MSAIRVVLMLIVDTVAQVSAKGQWRPSFDIIGPNASLSFRPANFDYTKPTGTWPRTESIDVRIVPDDVVDEFGQAEKLQAMLAFARRHLADRPEAA